MADEPENINPSEEPETSPVEPEDKTPEEEVVEPPLRGELPKEPEDAPAKPEEEEEIDLRSIKLMKVVQICNHLV